MNTLATSNPHVDKVAPVTVGEVQVRGAAAMGGGVSSAAYQMVLDLAEHGHVVFVHDFAEDTSDILHALVGVCDDPMDPRLARISFLKTTSSDKIARHTQDVEEHRLAAGDTRKVSVVVQKVEELDHCAGDTKVAHRKVSIALKMLAEENRAVVAYSVTNRRSDLDVLSPITTPGSLGNQHLVEVAGTVLTMTRERPLRNPANQPTGIKGRMTLENPRAAWHVFKVNGSAVEELVTIPMRFDVDHGGFRGCWYNG